MEMGVESPESGRAVATGILMEFPVSEGVMSCSPPTVPSRLRQRLSEPRGCATCTVDEIEAKLRGANLRRQKFYEHLSSKARPKPRSPSQSSSSEEDRGQRLEAKLQAAEQKRLDILAKAQMRLAKLDELRQAARTGAEMRFRKERTELGTKVELRVRKAEANRMHILKACWQRRASLKERSSQSLLRRMARESKYKERVRAAISRKRAAAEKKRSGLLEAEKRRARARIVEVLKKVESISHQREIEKREIQNKLEDRLQRAEMQRAQYLMQRGKGHKPVHGNVNKVQQANDLARKLARCWKRFYRLHKPTLHLAKLYKALNISESSVKSMPFEQLALLIESSSTIQAVKALLDRLESRYKISRGLAPTSSLSTWDDIDHLLKRVASPKRRATPRRSTGSRVSKKLVSTREVPKAPAKLSRYQVRVVLCAYMILGHPASVFSGKGEREIALAESAEKFVKEFELLIRIILEGPIQTSNEESVNTSIGRQSFKSQLTVFDSAWCSYLNSFVLWKVKDALSLEEDLVRAACQLELSMIQTCKMTPNGDFGALTHDMKAIQRQVISDQKLLKEKVHHLSGDAGIERIEAALSDTRMRYFQAKENGSPLISPITCVPTPSSAATQASPPSLGTSDGQSNLVGETRKPSQTVRRLFNEEVKLNKGGTQSKSYSSDGRMDLEKVFIVNESVHGGDLGFNVDPNSSEKQHNSIKDQVKETMRKAFWDGIMESVEQNEPNLSRIFNLVEEVRDEICGMAPESWKQEIFDAMDLEILSQLLASGNLDMDYLGKILEFALVTLQKLSALADVDKLKATHQKFLEDLSEVCKEASGKSCFVALLKGLRFVLEQIQVLKQEICEARIRLLQPLLKGPAGLDFLRKAFESHYGSPDDAMASLPLTMQWLSYVKDGKDQEWAEHSNLYINAVKGHGHPSNKLLPSTTLKTGGNFSVGSSSSFLPTTFSGMVVDYPECMGEKVDLLVRLGLLKLVCEISGLTEESMPETLKLNLIRLRAVQARIQKIIVMATSILVLQQTFSMNVVTGHADIEGVMPCVNELSRLLDIKEDAGISHIVEILSKLLDNGGHKIDRASLESMKSLMASMLLKSLQAGDTIFSRISRATYLAIRGVLLGGTSLHGRQLAEVALKPVGAALLTDEVVEAASVLGVVANVSVNIHGPWYTQLVVNM